MNNSFPLEQTSKTVHLDFNLILRHSKLDLTARFMQIRSLNTKLRHDQKAKELGCSSSALKRYRHDIKMLSPYSTSSNTHKRRQKISNTNLDDN